MADLRKMRAGDPLRISAGDWNAMIDVVRAYRTQQATGGGGPPRPGPNSGIIAVRNDSGAPLDRFGVLGIAGSLITPDDSLPDFAARVALRGVLPTEEHVGRFAVFIEPVDAGTIGRAVLDGLVQVRVELLDPSHRFAEVAPAQTQHLVSGLAGTAVIVWADEPVDDVAWAIVRLGGGAGGSGVLVPCYVEMDGGGPGNSETACTWTYSLYSTPESETPFAEDVECWQARTAVGWYNAAPDMSLGFAYADPVSGLWRLMICREAPHVLPCVEPEPE